MEVWQLGLLWIDPLDATMKLFSRSQPQKYSAATNNFYCHSHHHHHQFNVHVLTRLVQGVDSSCLSMGILDSVVGDQISFLMSTSMNWGRDAGIWQPFQRKLNYASVPHGLIHENGKSMTGIDTFFLKFDFWYVFRLNLNYIYNLYWTWNPHLYKLIVSDYYRFLMLIQ